MGSSKNRICVWNAQNLEDYNDFDILPNCQHHEHMSRGDAHEIVQNLLYTTRESSAGKVKYVFEAIWCGPRRCGDLYNAMLFTDPKDYVIRDSGGMNTHQLVSAGM